MEVVSESLVSSAVNRPKLLDSFTPNPDFPGWFQAEQWAAWEEFEQLPPPARSDEAWRFSNRSAFDPAQFVHPGRVPADGIRPEDYVGLERTAARLVFVNHSLVHQDVHALPEGVRLLSLQEAMTSEEELFRKYFMKHPVVLGSARFAALHKACLGAGVFLLTGQGVTVDLPIEVTHFVVGKDASLFPHSLVVCDRGSRATLVERFLSLDESPAFACAINDLHLLEDSNLTYVALQQWSRAAAALHLNSTFVGCNASCKSLLVNLGGRSVRSESHSRLAGEGSRSDMLAISPASGSQEFDLRTLQDHLKPNTASDLLFHNSLDDKAKAVFSGLIRVEKLAHRVDAYQKDRNLVLSDDAAADYMPGLEILADDVRCSHGATYGSLDEEQLFYMAARGLPLSEARRLLTAGFFGEVLARLKDDALAAFVQRALEKRLERK